MAKTPFSAKKHDINTLNSGYQYTTDDQMSIEALNNTIENSFYASDIAEDVAEQLSNLGTGDKIEFKGSNPNLLINSDFRVNQKGLTTYTVLNEFTVDAWKLSYGSLTVNSDGSVTHTATNTWQGIRQFITNPSRLAGKTITLSVNSSATTNKLAQISMIKQGSSTATNIGSTDVKTGAGITSFTATIPSDITDNDQLYVLLYTPQANQSITYYWTKLEIGSVATTFSPKPYEEELADCQCIEGGIATTYSNPNLLINGDFSVNQRKFDGTNFERLKAVYCFDRWRYYHWGNSAEITKNDDGSITIYNTTTDTSQGTGIIYFAQPVERFAPRTCNNETYTISLKYKLEYPDSSKRGDCYFYFEQAGATTSGTITGKLSKTETPVIDTRTFTVNGTTTKGVVAVNLRQGAKLTIYWVKLETGSVATAFSPRTYAEELALCQRYFRILNDSVNNYRRVSIGYAPTAKTARFIIPFGQMITLPTVPLDPTPSGFTIYSPNVPLEYVDAVPSVDCIMLNFKIPDDNTTTLTVNQPIILYTQSVSGKDGRIYLDAEIY